MNSVRYLIGSEAVCDTPLESYSVMVCDFMEELSNTMMHDSLLKKWPDVMSFAFWCRKGNIQALKKDFLLGKKRLGRGLVFHIAPSNIPVNFAFSYIFSLLAGNANIVRVPSRNFPQVEMVCNMIGEVLSNYPEIEKRTAFVRYPADNAITEKFCLKADARMIWGGDATIQEIRKCEVKPRCVDLVFADRYSLCVLDAIAIQKASDPELKNLAKAFYNDTYLMDQNACSSPQLICWLHASEFAHDRFWRYVADFAESHYHLQEASAVDKYTKMCQDAIERPIVKQIMQSKNTLYCALIEHLPNDLSALRGNCGYFYEYNMKDLTELKQCITEKVQTITCFGIDSQEIQDFVVKNHLRGIDRIVPIGNALDIGVIWDGYDIVRMLSRIVNDA